MLKDGFLCPDPRFFWRSRRSGCHGLLQRLRLAKFDLEDDWPKLFFYGALIGQNLPKSAINYFPLNTWTGEATCERPLTEGHKRRLQACHMLSERGFGVFKKGAYLGVHSSTLHPS